MHQEHKLCHVNYHCSFLYTFFFLHCVSTVTRELCQDNRRRHYGMQDRKYFSFAIFLTYSNILVRDEDSESVEHVFEVRLLFYEWSCKGIVSVLQRDVCGCKQIYIYVSL